jgi:hypothetical protein
MAKKQKPEPKPKRPQTSLCKSCEHAKVTTKKPKTRAVCEVRRQTVTAAIISSCSKYDKRKAKKC